MAKQHDIVLVLDDSDAWDGLYIDGKLVVQDGSLYAVDVLEAFEIKLKIPFRMIHVHMPGDVNRLPKKLADAEKLEIESS